MKLLRLIQKTKEPSTTKVINQFVKDTTKDIYKLTTVSGREIIATYDHLFMTDNGWKSVNDIEKDTMVGIHLTTNDVPNCVDKYVVLDENTFVSKLREVKVNEKLIETHLKKINYLLPIYSTSPLLPILARICGFIATDGCLNVYNKTHGGMMPQLMADFATKLDAEQFEMDVKRIGITPTIITETIQEYDNSIYHTWKISHNGVLPSLLIALDIAIGKKQTHPRIDVPQWVIEWVNVSKERIPIRFP